jgi:hypothetical protein
VEGEGRKRNKLKIRSCSTMIWMPLIGHQNSRRPNLPCPTRLVLFPNLWGAIRAPFVYTVHTILMCVTLCNYGKDTLPLGPNPQSCPIQGLTVITLSSIEASEVKIDGVLNGHGPQLALSLLVLFLKTLQAFYVTIYLHSSFCYCVCLLFIIGLLFGWLPIHQPPFTSSIVHSLGCCNDFI